MPTYDYECNACGHTLEIFLSFKDADLKKCPECGDKDFHQIITGGAGIVFKGSGFYANDSKASKKTATNTAKSSDGDTKKSDAIESGTGKDTSTKEKTATDKTEKTNTDKTKKEPSSKKSERES